MRHCQGYVPSMKCLTACAERHLPCFPPGLPTVCNEGLGNCRLDPGCGTTTRMKNHCTRGSHHNSSHVRNPTPLVAVSESAVSAVSVVSAVESVESVESAAQAWAFRSHSS